MALDIATRLGPYKIIAFIGKGGMGEVYRATDTTLKRQVALKILPTELAANRDRITRFRREAEILASLNHPNIAQIHGLEDSAGVQALVMEYVEGETLDQLMATRTSLAEVVGWAAHVADALAAAHAAGIVHRDLKPSNIIITSDSSRRGRIAKLLDFGIAKLAGPPPVNVLATTHIAPRDTIAGSIIGTVHYMSPEQSEGKEVDARSDVFSFGVLLYEMVTGRRPFERASTVATLNAILHEEPEPIAQLAANVPQELQRLIQRCLRKDPRRRVQVMDDVRIVLEDVVQDLTTGRNNDADVRQRSRWQRPVAIGALLTAIAITASFFMTTRAKFDSGALTYSPLATEPGAEGYPSWSTDGQSVAYVRAVNGVRQIFTRSIQSPVPTQVTHAPTDRANPFWSPDGARIYHNAEGHLWSVSAAGGEPQLVLKDADVATISPDGRVLAFLRGANPNRSLWIAATDRLDARRYETAPFPATFTWARTIDFSPDGAHIAVLVEPRAGAAAANELWVIPYPSGTPRRVLTAAPYAIGDAAGRVSWSADGRHIVIDGEVENRAGAHLFLVDVESGTIERVTAGTGREVSPSVSRRGERIAFVSGNADSDIVQISLGTGSVQALFASSIDERSPSWSPDGHRIAYVTNSRGGPEIWLRSLSEDWTTPVVTHESSGIGEWQNIARPNLSADGQRIAYDVVGATHGIWVSPIAGGRGGPLDQASDDHHSPSWSPDGQWIAYQRSYQGKWEIAKAPAGGGSPVRLAEGTPGGGPQTAWSATGQWIAYVRRGTLRVVAADGSIDKEILASATPAFGFSQDGKLLHAIRQGPGGWGLASFAVATGALQRIVPLPVPREATFSGFSLHPDGDRFATSMELGRFDIWMLEGFKPPQNWRRRFF